MSYHSYNINDFVWAKMRGYPYWPAIVTEPDPNGPAPRSQAQCWLYFFGSHDYTWLHPRYIQPYDLNRRKHIQNCSSHILEADQELRSHQKELQRDPNYKMDIVPFKPKSVSLTGTKSPSGRGRGQKRPRSVSSVDSNSNKKRKKSNLDNNSASRSVCSGYLSAGEESEGSVSTKSTRPHLNFSPFGHESVILDFDNRGKRGTTENNALNNFVWAKVAGFPYWPALIMEPDPEAPPRTNIDQYWVYFFGSHNYSWINKNYIKPYSGEDQTEYLNNCNENFVEAVEELRRNRRKVSFNPQYKMAIVPFKPKPKPTRKRSRSVASNRSRKSSYSGSVDSRGSKSRNRKRSIAEDNNIMSNSERQDFRWLQLENEDTGYLSDYTGHSRLVINKSIIGIMAGNIYAEPIIKNLYQYGHSLAVWSESVGLSARLRGSNNPMNATLEIYKDPRDVVARASIIFSLMMTDKEVLEMLNRLGADKNSDLLLREKIYVEMTPIDQKTSRLVKKQLDVKQAIYLEAMMQGTREDAENQKMFILIGGEALYLKRVFAEYQSCFWVLMKHSCSVVSEICGASKFNTVLQSMKAVLLAGFVEVLALAEKVVGLEEFFEFFSVSPCSSDYLTGVLKRIKEKGFTRIEETVKELQIGLTSMLQVADTLQQTCPQTSKAEQIFKEARQMGLDQFDSSSVYLLSK